MLGLLPDAVFDGAALRTGEAVFVADGVILDVAPPERYPSAPIVRKSKRLLLPGFVNAHSHAFQRAFRGWVQDLDREEDDFWTWRERMYQVANALTPEEVYAVSSLAFLEMLEAGFTTVGEFHYLHHAPGGEPYRDPDELARQVKAAAEEVGLHLVLLRASYLRAGPGKPLLPEQLRFGERSLEQALAAVERLRREGWRVGLAPHSVRAVPLAELRRAEGFAGPLHVHAAEQPGEVRAIQAEQGCGPLAVLEAAGLLGPQTRAVHLTWPSAGDEDRLAESGAEVVLCPSTEMDLGDGFLPNPLRRSVGLSLGTDSHARICPFSEMRSLELHARGLAGRRLVLATPGSPGSLARRLIRAGTTAGDLALGGAGRGLVAGSPADFVLLDLDRPAADGCPPLEAAALLAEASWVDEVWVGGERRVRAGQHPRRAEIRARGRAAIASVLNRSGVG